MATTAELQFLASMGYPPKEGTVASDAGFGGAVQDNKMGLFDLIMEDKKDEEESIYAKGLEKASVPISLTSMPEGTMERLYESLGLPAIDDNKPAKIYIPLSPEITASTVAFGDMVGDSWRGLKQILQKVGISDLIDEEVQDQNEAIMRGLYDDNAYGSWAIGGAIAGAITEPIGLLIPAGKFKTVKQAMVYSGVMGGLYGSTLYVDREESRTTNAILGTILGGGAGGLLNRWQRHALGKKLANELSPDWHATGEYSRSGKPIFRQLSKVEHEAETVMQLEAKASVDGSRLSTLAKGKDWVDEFIRPVYDVIKSLHKGVADVLRQADADQHYMLRKWTDRTENFNKFMDKLPLKAQEMLHASLLDGGLDKQVLKAIRQLGGEEAVVGAKEVTKVLKEVRKELKDVGHKIGTIQDYFPSAVRDHARLAKKMQTEITRAIATKEKSMGKKMTAKQKARLGQSMMTRDRKFSNAPTGLKSRKVEKVLPENRIYYHDPVTALHFYLNSMSDEIAKRRFFQRFGHKPGKAGHDITGGDIGESVDSLIETIAKDVLPKDHHKIVQALQARFSADVHKVKRGVQGIKNLSFASTLGNYWSAMTQIGDLVFALDKYGLMDTVAAMIGPKITNKERMGITKAMAELNSEKGWTSTVADWAFKWGGFDKIDGFGKNVNVNAAIRHWKRIVRNNPEKFVKRWGFLFGDDTKAVMKELNDVALLKDQPISKNLNALLWNELAETQPIGMSEQAVHYLKNPNMRILYAYKTFTLKQMNYMRNKAFDAKAEPNAAKRAYNLTKFMGLFVAANASIDVAKGFLSGDKEIDFEDKLIDNVLGLLATSRYVVDKQDRKVASIMWQMISPVPIEQLVKAANRIQSGETTWGDVADQLPLVGKINKEYDIVK